MKVGQYGTARDGQRGVISEVYPNAIRFLSTTGAHFTLLNDEFTPDNATKAVKAAIAKRAKAIFSHIKSGEGFRFRVRRGRGKWHKVPGGFIRAIPGYLGVPDGEDA
jgi:hypothetical protein